MDTIPVLRGLLTSVGNNTSAGNSNSGGSRKRVSAIGSASIMLGRNGTAIVMNMMTMTISLEKRGWHRPGRQVPNPLGL